GRHRYEDAVKSFKHANEMHEKKCAECFYGMAQAYQGLQAYKNVVESCDKMIELADSNKQLMAHAYNLKGIALQSQDEIKDLKKQQVAEAVFRQGLALNTELPILHYNLGVTLLRELRDAEGIAQLKKYIQLQPDGSDAETASKLIANPRRAREAYARDSSFTTSEGAYIALHDLRGTVVLVDRFPTYILIDHEGIVRFRVSGLSFEREAALNEAIHKQIKIVAKSGPAE